MTLSYLCGHSLGPLVRSTRARIEEELGAWGRMGIGGYGKSPLPWMRYAHDLRPTLARLVGARADEVAIMNSLTVNLHMLLARFYQPQGRRRKILIDAPVFPSDRMAVSSQIAWRGGDPSADLIVIGPRPGEWIVEPDAFVEAIHRAGDTLALVWVGGVNYLSGHLQPLGRLARATHECGALCGADLAHAIGNVALDLDRDEIDFAVWCSYKYLNGGPGAVGGLFVRSPSPKEAPHPALEGWWGHEETTRFLMGPDFRPEEGALGFAVSNVPVLSTTPLHAALPLFDRYPFAQLVEKRESLIDYTLSRLMDLELPGLSCITPLDPGAHGAQLSFMIGPNRPRGEPLIRALAACGVIADWREPHILRVAFHPLYNGFQDAERLVQGLARIIRSGQ
ncbi:Kynureninase [mine drainage metagenome]|uniref:Kynureninase n=2 Tax=mine drainage metagenome TaxID=410659 RepID=T1BTD8_9ZZZZ